MNASASAEPTIRAALYLRVSLDATGEGLAVERQRQDCAGIAATRGWRVVAEFVDNSISAFDAARVRPGYDALVEAYARGEFDALVCWDLDRLTRQPRQLEDWIDAATDRGLILVTANGEADLSTDGGRMYARIKASVARAEGERKSARQRRAAQQRAELGRPPIGVPPRGYDVKGNVVEPQAAEVREMFRRFAAGDSLRGIVEWLNESGAVTRTGGPWNPSTVRGILVNPRYAGQAIYRGKPIGRPGAWEPLVDTATFAAVQAAINDPRRRTQVGTDRKHLGAGLFRCAECGTRVRSWSGNRYRCPEAHITRSQAQIDDQVLRTVRGRLARPDLAALLPVAEDAEVRALADEVKRLRARLATIEDDYDAGRIDGRRYAVASEKVVAELRTAEAAHGRASRARGSLDLLTARDPVAEFDAAPLMMQRAVVDLLCVVRLGAGERGRRSIDPESVRIEWRTA